MVKVMYNDQLVIWAFLELVYEKWGLALYYQLTSLINHGGVVQCLNVENADCHGLSNENKLVHLVKYKWKEISMFIESYII